MSGAFRAPLSANEHNGVISHSKDAAFNSMHLYQYYLNQLAVQNNNILTEPLYQTSLFTSAPISSTYFGRNLISQLALNNEILTPFQM
jgi:hypothetical protein